MGFLDRKGVRAPRSMDEIMADYERNRPGASDEAIAKFRKQDELSAERLVEGQERMAEAERNSGHTGLESSSGVSRSIHRRG